MEYTKRLRFQIRYVQGACIHSPPPLPPSSKINGRGVLILCYLKFLINHYIRCEYKFATLNNKPTEKIKLLLRFRAGHFLFFSNPFVND